MRGPPRGPWCGGLLGAGLGAGVVVPASRAGIADPGLARGSVRGAGPASVTWGAGVWRVAMPGVASVGPIVSAMQSPVLLSFA